MKKLLIGLFLISLMSFVSCGGGSGSDNPPTPEAKTMLLNSFEAFDTLMDGNIISQCVQSGLTTCDCPGGGSLTYEMNDAGDDIDTVSFAGCKTEGGSEFTGSLTLSDTTADANFSKFDECTNLEGNDINVGEETTPSGTITATCGTTFTCEITTNDAGEEDCK